MNFHLLLFVALFTLATAKLSIVDKDHPDKIDGQYIVIYHDNTTENDMTRHLKQFANDNNEVTHIYNINDEFKGFSAKLDAVSVQQLLDDPLVKEFYNDIMVYLDANTCGATQSDAPSWGLGRMSAKGHTYRTPYWYDSSPTSGGDGVDVYVLDTGVLTTHPEFEGRAYHGVNYAGGPNTDQNGHGTHCAGTIGGSWVGVAKRATIYSVKVLGANGGGTLANVIAGVNYVANQGGNRPAVGSMSLGSTYNAAVNNAVSAAVNSGTTMVVAAGNSNANACNYSPASTPNAISVGASDQNDARSSFSNFGSCTHVFAPGTGIYSCYLGNGYSTLSGTSMACPHVAGQAAVIYSENRGFSPAQVKQRVQQSAQSGLLSNVGAGSPNLLLYNGCDE